MTISIGVACFPQDAGDVRHLLEAADAGTNLLVLCDDAYFGLFYEVDVLPESLFARLAGRHELRGGDQNLPLPRAGIVPHDVRAARRAARS